MVAPIVLSDENINRYGLRLMTNGIQLANFQKDPAMFYNLEGSLLRVGNWVDIRNENGKLTAIPLFDESPFAQELKSEYKKGTLNAASIGIDVLKISNAPELQLPEQTNPTIMESLLREVLIARIPQDSSVKLGLVSIGMRLSSSSINLIAE